MIDRQRQRRHAYIIGCRVSKGLGTLLFNKPCDILADKAKQHKQTALTAAKRQTLDTHLHLSLSQSIRGHALARAQAPKP